MNVYAAILNEVAQPDWSSEIGTNSVERAGRCPCFDSILCYEVQPNYNLYFLQGLLTLLATPSNLSFNS